MTRHPSQYENPACLSIGNVDMWIDETVENKPQAIQVCRQCSHVIECAEYGVSNEVVGIWGGLTTAQRIDLATAAGITRQPILTPVISPRKRVTND